MTRHDDEVKAARTLKSLGCAVHPLNGVAVWFGPRHVEHRFRRINTDNAMPPFSVNMTQQARAAPKVKNVCWWLPSESGVEISVNSSAIAKVVQRREAGVGE